MVDVGGRWSIFGGLTLPRPFKPSVLDFKKKPNFT